MSMGKNINSCKSLQSKIIIEMLYKQIFIETQDPKEREKLYGVCTNLDLKAISNLHRQKTYDLILNHKNDDDYKQKLNEYNEFAESLIIEKVDRLRTDITLNNKLPTNSSDIFCDFEKKIILDSTNNKEQTFSFIQPNEPEDRLILKDIESSYNSSQQCM